MQALGRLSMEAGVELSKGAGAGVKKQATEIFAKQGRNGLAKLCKTHFSNFCGGGGRSGGAQGGVEKRKGVGRVTLEGKIPK